MLLRRWEYSCAPKESISCVHFRFNSLFPPEIRHWGIWVCTWGEEKEREIILSKCWLQISDSMLTCFCELVGIAAVGCKALSLRRGKSLGSSTALLPNVVWCSGALQPWGLTFWGTHQQLKTLPPFLFLKNYSRKPALSSSDLL